MDLVILFEALQKSTSCSQFHLKRASGQDHRDRASVFPQVAVLKVRYKNRIKHYSLQKLQGSYRRDIQS